MNKRELGKQGEQIAADYLIKKGYELIESNAHQRWGELDLITKDPKTHEIIFVEVKLRRGGGYGHPEEGVNMGKLRNIIGAAERWMMKQKRDMGWRIDVVGITMKNGQMEIEHWENVTQEMM